MLNTSNDLFFVCKAEDVVPLIIKAAKLTEKNISDAEGRTSVHRDEAINESSKSLLKFTFIQYFADIEDNRELSKEWLNSLYHLVTNRTYSSYAESIPTFFTDESKLLKRQKAKLEKLRSHLHLFLHNVWCVKAALLPTTYSRLPFEIVNSKTEITAAGRPKKTRKYIAESFYPEILKIVRSPLMVRPFSRKFIDQLPESAIKNLDWYAHRVIRAQDVWDVTDLTEKHLEAYRDISKDDLGFAKSTGWVVAIVELYGKKLGFDASDIHRYSAFRSGEGLKEDPSKWLSKEEAELNPNHLIWEKHFKEYANELIDQGYSSGHTLTSALRRVILAPLLAKKTPFPPIIEYGREHIAISRNSLKKRLKSPTVDGYLRKMKDFLEWLELVVPEFKNPFYKKIDLPRARRPKGTNKVLAPEGAHQAMLSYNYAICDWIEYINYNISQKLRRTLILKTNTKCLIETEQLGFTPIYRIDGIYRPIRQIPSTLLSPIRVSENIKKNGSLNDDVLYPHYSNLTALIMETGIRLIHCRWLDSEIYDLPSFRPITNPKSYGVNKIHVNTDKSHGAWDATVSDSVVNILDSQLKFKKTFLRGKDEPVWYDNKPKSLFGKITPLFATAPSNYKLEDSFRVATDDQYRKYFKCLIKSFSFEMLVNEETKRLAIVENPKKLNLLEFVNDKSIKVNVTPHSSRSQVVSDNISLLPPSIIKDLTGHADVAHVIYYAQIKDSFIDVHEQAEADKFMDEIESALTNTQTQDSPLQKALRGDNLGEVLVDFGAISFSENTKNNELRDGISKLREINKDKPFKRGLSEQLYFDTTHICPFGNKCPSDVINRFESSRKHCGECPYSIKTIDHIPAITMKLRKYTDYLNDAQSLIDEAKKRKESMSNMQYELAEKKFYANEIAAWSATHSLLYRMTEDLSKKEQWLVEEPEIISKRLSQMKATNELTLALVKINDAEKSATYMTPALRAQISKLRKKLLISTKDYEKLLVEPEGYSLLSEFKGLISTVCKLSGVSTLKLGDELEKITNGSKLALGFKSREM
jgi:hypothetical protein